MTFVAWTVAFLEKVARCKSSRSQLFFKIGVLKNFANFTGKHLCLSLFLNKVTGPATLLKKDSNTGVFLYNLGNI